MADDIAAATDSICPWCSSALPAPAVETCPSCGAQLVPDTDAPVPGVTAIDPEAIVRAAHQPTPQRRNRLLSWISGEYDPGEDPIAAGSVAPPDPAVRREMLRLELEAEVANLQAEAGLVLTEAEVEASEEGLILAEAEATGAVGGSPEGAEAPAATMASSARDVEAPATDIDAPATDIDAPAPDRA